MGKPVIMTVDDEPEVLNAIERDLRQHFRSEYRIVKVGSGLQALETTRQLKERNIPVALFLGAQVVLLTALGVRGFAAPGGPESWRHTGLAFAVGLGAPWLLVVGLLPGLSCSASLLGSTRFSRRAIENSCEAAAAALFMKYL